MNKLKIVINKCYGGYGVSKEAIFMILEKSGYKDIKEVAENPDDIYSYDHISAISPEGVLEQFTSHDFDRIQDRTSDEVVSTVEELGEKANGPYAELKVIELDEDVSVDDIYVDDYDGIETVHEYHRQWS